MKIRVEELKHHPKNKEIYTLSAIEDLVSSIAEVGLLQPLVVDKNNYVISGNRRLEALKKLGWEWVEIKRVTATKKESEKLLVHHNKQRIKSCKELINEYKALYENIGKGQGRRTDLTSDNVVKGSSRDLIAKELGLSSGQLQKLLYIEKNEPSHIELIDRGIMTVNQSYVQVTRKIKERSSKEKKNESVLGRSPSKTSSWKTYIKSSDYMVEVGDESIQTIFTSPPYWNKRNYGLKEGLGSEKTPEEFISRLLNHLDDCKRVLSPRGSFFLNMGDTFYNSDLQNIPHRVAIGLQQRGWILRNTIIWSKTNPKPSASKSNLTPSYEFIFHLTKGVEYDYYPTLSKMSEKTRASLPPRHRGLKSAYSLSISPYIPSQDGKNMGDFWNEEIVRTAVANQKRISDKEHPAPFPEQIVLLPILQTSKEGQTILDPFMGRGTVGKVCDYLSRNFIGYDIVDYLVE